MKLKNGMWPVLIAGSLVMGGCGSNAMGADVSQSGGQQDYGATKTMVIDILHSQEGKTALQDVMKDPTFKQQLVVSEADITKAVTASVESKKTQSFLAEQAKDPKFAAALAKAVQPDLISTSKQLMKDPDYQKDMLTLLQSPDFTKSLQTLLQGPQFRQDVMKIMTQALDTPAFRMKFQDSLKAAVADSMKSTGGSSSGGSGGGSDGASGGSSSSGAKEGGGS
jgi:spore germination protein D